MQSMHDKMRLESDGKPAVLNTMSGLDMMPSNNM